MNSNKIQTEWAQTSAAKALELQTSRAPQWWKLTSIPTKSHSKWASR